MSQQDAPNFAQRLMRWNRRYVIWFVGVALVAAVAGLLLLRSDAAASPSSSVEERATQQTIAGSYRWSYAIKFVCGYQPEMKLQSGTAFLEPVVKPGNYATDININNPNAKELPLVKWITVLVKGQDVVVREPESAAPAAKHSMVLKPYYATMDDCNNLWRLLQMPMPPPPASSLTVGYLVIQSPLELDIDAVYTAEVPGGLNAAGQMSTPTGVSIDVERVPGKRIFVPLSTLPGE